DKSRVYFSAKVSRSVQHRISSCLGIRPTQDLGRYLGVPLIHGRNSKQKYLYLIERIERKLAGWKVNSLSFAGRVSLAISTLNSIPTYVMQTTSLPIAICNIIDRKIRSFIWGSKEGARKIHLVNWESICKPKDQGGLGVRSAKELNQAFIMKLTWGLMKNTEALWVKVLKTKYLKQYVNGFSPCKSKRWSSCWKGINETWPIFTGGLYWGIRNGKQTNFWRERWLDDGTIIGDLIQPPTCQANWVVADFCTSDDRWDLTKLADVLPDPILQGVMGMSPPCNELDEDIPIWGLEPHGMYSVKTGYLLAKGLRDAGSHIVWRKIWRWEGTQRVRQFLWVAYKNRLLTNQERYRRHLTTDNTCGMCMGDAETTEHVLRSCSLAKQVWTKLLLINESDPFFSLNLESWWNKYLTDKDMALQFGTTCWLLWKYRNERIFEGVNVSANNIVERCLFWTQLTRTACTKMDDLRNNRSGLRINTNVAWNAAPWPNYTLNTDGSVLSSGKASAGGCLRDGFGKVVDAFSSNLGICSITRSEIVGVMMGLERAWAAGIRKVEVQTDSICVIKLLSKDHPLTHQHATAVSKIRRMLQREWTVYFTHIYREANFLADHLANKGHELALGSHTIDNTDRGIAYWARYDLFGGSETRSVLLS
ncbi:Putative ribonuclease H protein At1g65750, partial [Linum perenne]